MQEIGACKEPENLLKEGDAGSTRNKLKIETVEESLGVMVITSKSWLDKHVVTQGKQKGRE